MMKGSGKGSDEYLKVYIDRSELHTQERVSVYYEGFQDTDTQARYAKLNKGNL